MTSDDADDEHIRFNFPDELPVLNRRASRILLAILVRLTEVEVLEGPQEGGSRDC
jgi:hypothetical protein